MDRVDTLWQNMLSTGLIGTLPATFLSETTSTNEIALEAALQGAETHTLFIAETQSMGRGRLGKNWLSPSGTGLYFSMILRPFLETADLPKITLAAGLAACKGVESVTNLSPMIKWPNDLLLDGKKFAGILAETESLGNDARPIVILGVGMNVNTSHDQFTRELQINATSLKNASGTEYPRGRLLKEITGEIVRTISLLEKNGFSEILSEWKTHDATLGQELQWVTQKGNVVSGLSLGPDDNGLLRIRDKTGSIHEVLSGDLTLARKR